MISNDTLILIAVAIIPVIYAIVLHEIAHGWVAYKLGDNTAKQLGRLSINPFKHIDPIGTVLVPVLMIVTLGFAFGWAKPVPVDWRKLNRPKQDMVYVAAAGPFANLLMIIFWGVLAKIVISVSTSGSSDIASILLLMAMFGIGVNLVLMLLNLIPVPPLDGGRIAVGLLPMKYASYLARIERFGLLTIVLILVLLNQVFANEVNGFLLGLINFVRNLFGLG